ncbi:DUF4184 family protein [Phytohabitans kaempferiae]|uniref:DUF4184 family protein n=1 Tax=Phytohabitans kaempferiae TaxID=1620943 RepID=A0ABV6M1V7_9ACTN
MPFTGSHPAAVLPLTRSGLLPSALVIGSLVPDLPYYLPTPVRGATTHTLAAAVSVDVLLGLVVFAVWHALLAPFAIAIGPRAVRDRLRPPAPRPSGLARRAVWPLRLLVSLAVGAATHVVWDSFTHQGRWGPAHIGWLAQSHAGLPGYRWAQYASGVVGAAALALWLARWWRANPPTAASRGRRPVRRAVAVASWALILSATAVVGLLAALRPLADADLRVAVFLAITRGGGAGIAAALLCAATVAVVARRPPRSPGALPGT